MVDRRLWQAWIKCCGLPYIKPTKVSLVCNIVLPPPPPPRALQLHWSVRLHIRGTAYLTNNNEYNIFWGYYNYPWPPKYRKRDGTCGVIFYQLHPIMAFNVTSLYLINNWIWYIVMISITPHILYFYKFLQMNIIWATFQSYII